MQECRKNTFTLNRGDKAPNFYLVNVKGEYQHLSDYKGKVVLLNFWEPGCMPCKYEIPYEKKLIKDLEGKDFCLINICFVPNKETWKHAVKLLGMEGINLYAEKGWQKKLFKDYNMTGWPHYTLIDKNGIIVSNHPKRPSEGVLEDIKELLN